MKRAFVVAALISLSLLSACGQLPATGPSPSATPSATASPRPTPTATPEPTATPSPSATVTPTLAPWPPAGFTVKAVSGGGGGSASVAAVRVGAHPGYDRFVIEFAGPVPAYTVSIQQGARFTLSPSGKTAVLSGSNGVVVTIQHVANWTGYTGPLSLELNSAYLTAVRQIQNFEGVQQWGLGIRGEPAIRVATLGSPSRLVIDVIAR